jgi:glycosyltransferase involved in cell wall biosynthesis
MSRTSTRLSPSRQAIASRIGLMIHASIARVRRRASIASPLEPGNVAVMCVGFLRYGVAQAVGLTEAGRRVTLYYVDRKVEFAASKEDRAMMLDHARAAGVTVVRVPPRRAARVLADTYRLHRDLRRRRIGTVIMQSHSDPRYATIGLTSRVALMLHDPRPHSGDEVSRLPLLGRAIARVGELTSACIVLHSERLLDQVRPLLRRLPIGVVPHGANMAASPMPVPPGRQLLLFGRLFAYKGVDTALDAFQQLPCGMSDVTMVVAGQGPLGKAASGMRNVEVRNEYIAEDEVEELLANARVVLLPYKDATQSGVGLQALARGVPCVVSAAGGLPDLAEDIAPTLVVPPDDPARLAQAISEHLDHDHAFRRKVYDHASRSFSWPVVARRLCEEVDRLAPS